MYDFGSVSFSPWKWVGAEGKLLGKIVFVCFMRISQSPVLFKWLAVSFSCYGSKLFDLIEQIKFSRPARNPSILSDYG